MPDLLNLRGRPVRVSPSAVDTYNTCPRKDVFRRILCLPDKPSPGAELGTKVHDLAENYLKHGDGPSSPVYFQKASLAWRILEPGLAHLPAGLVPGQLGDTWEVERVLEHTVAGVPFTGKIDYWGWPQGRGSTLLVGDWKTSSSPDLRYAKDAAALAGYVQPNAYAYVLGQELGLGADDMVEFQHINLATQAKGGMYNTRSVRTTVPYREVVQAWREQVVPYANWLTQTVGRFAPHYSDPDALVRQVLEVQAKTEACGAFGGCAYRDVCPAARSIKDKNMNRDAMRAALRGQTEKNAPPPAAAEPAPVAAQVADPTTPLANTLRTKGKLTNSMIKAGMGRNLTDMDTLIAAMRDRHGLVCEMQGTSLVLVSEAKVAAPAAAPAPDTGDTVEAMRQALIGVAFGDAKALFRTQNPGAKATTAAVEDWLSAYDLGLDEEQETVIDLRPPPPPPAAPAAALVADEVEDDDADGEDDLPTARGNLVVLLCHVAINPAGQGLPDCTTLDAAVIKALDGTGYDTRRLFTDQYGTGWKELEAHVRENPGFLAPGHYTVSRADQSYRLVSALAETGAVVLVGTP